MLGKSDVAITIAALSLLGMPLMKVLRWGQTSRQWQVGWRKTRAAQVCVLQLAVIFTYFNHRPNDWLERTVNSTGKSALHQSTLDCYCASFAISINSSLTWFQYISMSPFFGSQNLVLATFVIIMCWVAEARPLMVCHDSWIAFRKKPWVLADGRAVGSNICIDAGCAHHPMVAWWPLRSKDDIRVLWDKLDPSSIGEITAKGMMLGLCAALFFTISNGGSGDIFCLWSFFSWQVPTAARQLARFRSIWAWTACCLAADGFAAFRCFQFVPLAG